MVTVLRNEIYRLGKTVSGLSATNIWYLEAPQNTALPYCVFTEFAHPYSFDSGSQYDEVYVQFAIYETRVSNLETLTAALKAVFDFARSSFSVTGYNVITCVRMSDLPIQKFENVYSSIIQYKIEIQKSR